STGGAAARSRHEWPAIAAAFRSLINPPVSHRFEGHGQRSRIERAARAEAQAMRIDATSRESVRAAADEVEEHFGQIATRRDSVRRTEVGARQGAAKRTRRRGAYV